MWNNSTEVCWAKTLHCLACGYWCFVGIYCVHLHGEGGGKCVTEDGSGQRHGWRGRERSSFPPHNMMMRNGSSFWDAVYTKYSRHNVFVVAGERPSLLFCLGQHIWVRFCFPPPAHNWKRDNNLNKWKQKEEQILYSTVGSYFAEFHFSEYYSDSSLCSSVPLYKSNFVT